MLLVLDVGNTRVKSAVYSRGEKLAERQTLTASWKTPADVERFVRGILDPSITRRGQPHLAVSCVVPSVEAHLTQALFALSKVVKLPAVFIGPSCRLPIDLAVRAPERLGPDRIADAVAATYLHGSPVIVLNCGTALTMTVVDDQRRLIGGAIAPGLHMSAEALAAFTGRLPKVTIERFDPLPDPIGDDTEPAIRSGVLYAAIGAARELVTRTRAGLGCSAPVVVTGGYGGMLATFIEEPVRHAPDLTLQGIRLVGLVNGARD